MLINTGPPIDDAQAEIERIQSWTFEAAARLAGATGNNPAVSACLRLSEVAPEIPAVLLIPGDSREP